MALLAGSWYFTGQLRIERDNATWAMNNAKLSEQAAIENGKLAGKHRERAEAEALNARRNNYVLAMGQAQLAWQQAAVGRLKNLLRAQNSKPGEQDLRRIRMALLEPCRSRRPANLAGQRPEPNSPVGSVQSGWKMVGGARGFWPCVPLGRDEPGFRPGPRFRQSNAELPGIPARRPSPRGRQQQEPNSLRRWHRPRGLGFSPE